MTIEEMIAQIKGTHNNINGEDLKLLYECLPILEKQANMVEVVRCKDCVHYGEKGTWYQGTWYLCSYWDELTSPTDYCSNGKRREK